MTASDVVSFSRGGGDGGSSVSRGSRALRRTDGRLLAESVVSNATVHRNGPLDRRQPQTLHLSVEREWFFVFFSDEFRQNRRLHIWRTSVFYRVSVPIHVTCVNNSFSTISFSNDFTLNRCSSCRLVQATYRSDQASAAASNKEQNVFIRIIIITTLFA